MGKKVSVSSATVEDILPVRIGMTLKDAEKLLITATLEHTGWNVCLAARMLGIDRSTVYEKMKAYGIVLQGRSME